VLIGLGGRCRVPAVRLCVIRTGACLQTRPSGKSRGSADVYPSQSSLRGSNARQNTLHAPPNPCPCAAT